MHRVNIACELSGWTLSAWFREFISACQGLMLKLLCGKVKLGPRIYFLVPRV
jgi:hypothetical protein